MGTRLRRSNCSKPGIRRKRQGRGFVYLDELTGERIEDREALERIRALSIPPAWQDVWICDDPGGHLQAVGRDAAGRRQYLYHERWRLRRDQQKFDSMLAFARALPRIRRRVTKHLGQEGLPRERVLAGAVRLLDRGFFRIGGEDYANENGTYGLATMRKDHVRLLRGETILFDYVTKGGKERVQAVVDPEVYELVGELKRRRAGGRELLAYREDGSWRDVRSQEINEYLKEISGAEFSAKDFRTWNATVLAALALAVSDGVQATETARKRAISRVVAEVAHYLGNTPAVCRGSYIDPRLFDRFTAGATISDALAKLGSNDLSQPAYQGPIERAVVELLAEDD